MRENRKKVIICDHKYNLINFNYERSYLSCSDSCHLPIYASKKTGYRKPFCLECCNQICNLEIVKGKLISDSFGLIFFYIASQISSLLFLLNSVLWSSFFLFWGFLVCFFSLLLLFILIRGWKTISIQLISRMRNLHLFPVSRYGFSTCIYSDPDHNSTMSAAFQEITCVFQGLVMENLESNI